MGQPNKLRSGHGVRGTLAQRKARFREVKQLVTAHRRDVDTPMHLSKLARGVLGLLQVGIKELRSIAFYLNEDRIKVSVVLTAIQRCKNPIVMRALDEGLPACASVKVLWGTRLKCSKCQRQLESVPCPRCAPLWEDHYPDAKVYKEPEDREEEKQELELPAPAVATKAPPTIPKRFEHLYADPIPAKDVEFSPTDAPAGSKSKIDILAYRVSKGLPLWHPDDRVDYAGLTGVVKPRA